MHTAIRSAPPAVPVAGPVRHAASRPVAVSHSFSLLRHTPATSSGCKCSAGGDAALSGEKSPKRPASLAEVVRGCVTWASSGMSYRGALLLVFVCVTVYNNRTLLWTQVRNGLHVSGVADFAQLLTFLAVAVQYLADAIQLSQQMLTTWGALPANVERLTVQVERLTANVERLTVQVAKIENRTQWLSWLDRTPPPGKKT